MPEFRSLAVRKKYLGVRSVVKECDKRQQIKKKKNINRVLPDENHLTLANGR